MLGFGALGEFALGEATDSTVTYEPVSRIIAGGFSNGRPTATAVLTIIDYLQWDDESFIFWDDDTPIEWD